MKEYSYGDEARAFRRKVKQYAAAEKEAQEAVKAAEENLRKVREKHPHWIDNLVWPLVNKMAESFPRGTEKRVDGPFGVCHRVSAVFLSPKGALLGLINFAPKTGDNYDIVGITVTDLSTDTGEFGKNTIGAMNGMNNPEIDPPANAGVGWFVKKARCRRKTAKAG